MQEKKVETTLIKASVILLLVSTATSIIVFFLLNYMFDYSGSRLLFENDTSDFQTKSLSIYRAFSRSSYRIFIGRSTPKSYGLAINQ